MHLLGFHQRFVLLGQGVFRLPKDANKVLTGQRLQLDPDRKPALKFGNEIGRLGDVKRARSDEQDVIGADRAVLGIDGRALDYRQQVALDALARNVGTASAGLAPGDFVDFIDEDDAGLLGALDRVVRDLVHIDQPRRFFLRQNFQRLGNLDRALLGLLGHDLAEQVLHVKTHLFHALGGEDLNHRSLRAHLELDLAFVEMAAAEQLAQLLAGLAM